MLAQWPGIATRRRLSGALLAVVVAGCAPGVQTIDPAVLAGYIAEGKAGTVFVLVDLRDADSFRRSHLPGARSVPYADLAHDTTLFRDGRPVIFYDEGAPDAVRIAHALGDRLPDNIVVLAGGFGAWRAAGHPVMESTP